MHARLILNGKKADRPDIREAVKAVRAAGHDLEVRVTWERDDAMRLIAEAAREGVPRVIAGGGDGSVNEAANGLMAVDAATRPALGILPLGTANDFATACRVPAEAHAALMLAVTGEARPVDLGRCNDAFFVNVADLPPSTATCISTPASRPHQSHPLRTAQTQSRHLGRPGPFANVSPAGGQRLGRALAV